MANKVITSEAYELIKQDVIKAVKNVLKFSGPSLLIGLVSLQQGWDVKIALVAFGQALFSAFVDLAQKYLREDKYIV
jgi:hypothetical protein